MVFFWFDVFLYVSFKRVRELMVWFSGNFKFVSWFCFVNLEIKYFVIILV